MHDNLEHRLDSAQSTQVAPPPQAFTNAVRKSGRSFRIKVASAIIAPVIIAAAALPILINGLNQSTPDRVAPTPQIQRASFFLFGGHDLDQTLLELDERIENDTAQVPALSFGAARDPAALDDLFSGI